jgi:hypothetical protein
LKVSELIDNLKTFPPEFDVIVKGSKYDAEAILTTFPDAEFYLDINRAGVVVIEV